LPDPGAFSWIFEEEIERILGFVNSITRIGCICRKVASGKDKRFCYAISMGEKLSPAPGREKSVPDTSFHGATSGQ